jgi:hypothetical protein
MYALEDSCGYVDFVEQLEPREIMFTHHPRLNIYMHKNTS